MNEKIIKRYVIESEKLYKTYNILCFADTQFHTNVDSRLLQAIKDVITESEKKIDFILISGDIMSAKMYLNSKDLEEKKRILDNLSILADAPIFLSLGNHDLSLFTDKNAEKVIKNFESLKENTNLYPLNDRVVTYDGIDISGITLFKDNYDVKNLYGKNGRILNQKLNDFAVDPNKFNISLIHDPLSINYSYMYNAKNIEKFNLIFSGHLHGGYLKNKDLMARTVEKLEYTEYGRNLKPYVKALLVGGEYMLGDTHLVVTEGVRKFNGYIPWFCYTTPFFSEIELKSTLDELCNQLWLYKSMHKLSLK